MTRVVVIGGGIAGLSAAYFLADALGPDAVTVLEQTDQLGGKLRAVELAGHPVDVGAEAMLARRPEGVDLARAVGLGDRLHAPTTTSSRLWLDGGLRPMPAGTMMGVPADLDAVAEAGVLSADSLARAAAEASSTHEPLTEDVSVGDLITERLGRDVLDRLVDPLLGGVYAAPAGQISLRAAIPALAARLADGGSLVAAARAATAAGAVRTGPVFMSFPGGLAELPAALARSGFQTRTRTAVRVLRRTPDGFALECGPVPEPVHLDADAVVMAAPPGKTGPLLRELAPVASTALGEIGSTSVAVVSLAFRDITLPAASGFLVPATERRAIKGATFSSQKWPIGADGVTLLRASLGRAGEPTVLQREDAELVRLVRHELRSLLGVDAEPIDTAVTRWGGGLPQYTPGHVERVARIRAAVADVPGLAVCGAAYDGVGVPACIASARLAADRVLASLTERGQWTRG